MCCGRRQFLISVRFSPPALRAYVEVFSSKPPDWQSFVKFYIVPPVVATSGFCRAIARHVSMRLRDAFPFDYAMHFRAITWHVSMRLRDAFPCDCKTRFGALQL
jgi:hypothetical protein